MAARSIASLTISFGLVSIPVKLYTATESSAAIRFKLMGQGGVRLRQQYVADALPAQAAVPEPEPPPSKPGRAARDAGFSSGSDRVLAFPSKRPPEPEPEPPSPAPMPDLEATVERSEMLKGYEFEKGQFVLFTADELAALEGESRQSIDIVSFIPESSVDPIYYDKPYFLVPDKRGAKPYSLLLRAMEETGRCALAKWAWRSKEYVVQIRPGDGGLVLQQLLYADEVRSLRDLDVETVDVSPAEVALAKQIIEQISADSYDPGEFVDEEKQRILAAVERKIAGQQIVSHAAGQGAPSASAAAPVVDLMAALRASLQNPAPHARATRAPALEPAAGRKPAKRSGKPAEAPAEAAPAARKRAKR
jgi:DNA end-binding protein Ku